MVGTQLDLQSWTSKGHILWPMTTQVLDNSMYIYALNIIHITYEQENL